MPGQFIHNGKKYFPICDKVGKFRSLSDPGYFIVTSSDNATSDSKILEIKKEDLTFMYCNLDDRFDDSKLNMITIAQLEEILRTFINSDNISNCGNEHLKSFLCIKHEEDYIRIKDIVRENFEDIISLFKPEDCDSFFKHPLSIYSDNIGFKKVMCMLVISPITEAKASINTYGELFADFVSYYLY
jgi:hypothetical protein